jgi:pimeloyl-ACP methyl ester carboxylesterase
VTAGSTDAPTTPDDDLPELVLPALGVGPVDRFRVAVEGGCLAAASVGGPAAPAWVIAHGVGSSARFVAAAFAGPVVAAGGRLVVYDLRGHGASSPAHTVGEHHLDVHVADLIAVAAGVRTGVEVIGGISLGGHAAARAVAQGRLDAAGLRTVLACLPAWTGPAVSGIGPHAAVAAQVRRIGIAAIIEQLRHEPGLVDWLRSTLVTDYARHDPASLAAALLALDGGDAPTEAELAALSVPLALVAWPDDPGHPLAVAEHWAALAPRSVLRTIAIGELDGDVERLGRRAVAAVAAAAAGVVPRRPPVPRGGSLAG